MMVRRDQKFRSHIRKDILNINCSILCFNKRCICWKNSFVKIVYFLLTSLMRDKCLSISYTHWFNHLVTLTEGYQAYRYLMCNYLQLPITSSFIRPYVLFLLCFSDTSNLCWSSQLVYGTDAPRSLYIRSSNNTSCYLT